MKLLRTFFLCLTLAILSGCAPKGQPLLPQSEAASRWEAFAQRSADPVRNDILSGSLRFGTMNDTQRITYLLWSGLDTAVGANGVRDRIIRMDIGTAAGSSLGSLLFKDGRMLLVLPSERRAYVGEASKRNLRRMLGLPLPFDMQGVLAVLDGHLYLALDAPSPERYELGNDDNIVYRWRDGATLCELELSPQALPVRWTVSGGWDMAIVNRNGLPTKLSGQLEQGDETLRMILLVKERRPGSSLTSSSLRLDIPAGFDIFSID